MTMGWSTLLILLLVGVALVVVGAALLRRGTWYRRGYARGYERGVEVGRKREW